MEGAYHFFPILSNCWNFGVKSSFTVHHNCLVKQCSSKPLKVITVDETASYIQMVQQILAKFIFISLKFVSLTDVIVLRGNDKVLFRKLDHDTPLRLHIRQYVIAC